MSKETEKTATYSFRWGVPILDAARRYIQVYDFMLCNYRKVSGQYVKTIDGHQVGDEWEGVERREFLVIIHLASRHYEVARGRSAPALATIADEMGYSVRGLQKVIRGLEAKGMMLVTQRDGQTSIYDCGPFARACFALWKQSQGDEPHEEQTSSTDSRIVTDASRDSEPRANPRMAIPLVLHHCELRSQRRNPGQRTHDPEREGGNHL